MQKSIIVIMCACLCISCASTRVPDNRSGASSVREHIGELGSQQTELAITGTELENRIERSSQLVGELEQTVTDGTDNIAELKRIIDCIRKRGGTSTDRTE